MTPAAADPTTTVPTPPTAPASSIAPAAVAVPAAPARQPPRGAGKGASGAKGGASSKARAPRPTHPALERLFQLYPKLFGKHFLPLKLGVFQELMATHPDHFKKDELKVALGLHARSTRYLEAVASGAPRHGLDGQPVEPVAPEHVHHAVMEVWNRRRQQRPSGKDASGAAEAHDAWLRAKLADAVERSGLARDDYFARVHLADDGAQAALMDAFAEVGARTARREALRRAYAAYATGGAGGSGGIDAFADSIGADVREVRAAIEYVAPIPVPSAASASPDARTVAPEDDDAAVAADASERSADAVEPSTGASAPPGGEDLTPS